MNKGRKRKKTYEKKKERKNIMKNKKQKASAH